MRLKRESNPPVGQLASPIPQYKRPGSTDYDPVEGQHGAPYATLKDASGNVVSPATDAKLEQVRALLSGVATEGKLEQARILLNAINTKDFATASKQDALKTVVDDLKSELLLVKSELANIKANQLSGDQKVQLSGNIVDVQVLHNDIAITDTSLYGANSDVSNYKAFNIWIRNTLNQPIKVRYDIFLPPGKGNNVNYLEWKNGQWSQENFKTEIPAGGGVYNLTSIIKPEHRFTKMFRLIVRCDIAPTSGSVLSWVEGELR